MSSTLRVNIDPSAMPNYRGSAHLEWPISDNDIDDLVRFIYGNQGNLFVEDAALFAGEGRYVIRRPDAWQRIRASWEPVEGEVLSVNLTESEIDTIVAGLNAAAERMVEQQEATHDYSDDDFRKADVARGRVLRALKRL
jgi:hypothetical protein